MRKTTILVDLDDTMWDMMDAWTHWLHLFHGTSIRAQDVKSWDIRSYFPGLTEEQVFAPLHNPNFWRMVQPMSGCVEKMKELCSREDCRVFVVTATDYRHCPYKMDRLFELFPFLDWDRVILTRHKQLIQGDIIIDDAPHNLVRDPDTPFHIPVRILFSRPHNEGFEDPGVTRVYSWFELFPD